jgi:hypothetical protein
MDFDASTDEALNLGDTKRSGALGGGQRPILSMKIERCVLRLIPEQANLSFIDAHLPLNENGSMNDACIKQPVLLPQSVEARTATALIADVLADCSRLFGGDLDQFMVLTFVARAYHEAGEQAAERPCAEAGSISASTIAMQCGLPRETVRRKLRLLASRGCVRQTRDLRWRLVWDDFQLDGCAVLADITRLGMKSVARYFAPLGFRQVAQVAERTGSRDAMGRRRR